jgi:hypothetical protein
MRRLLFAAALCLPLAACGGGTISQSGKADIVQAVAKACEAYAVTLNLAADAEDAHLLSQANVTAIDKARGGANSLCQGPQPTDLTSALVSITVATAQIAAAYSGGN